MKKTSKYTKEETERRRRLYQLWTEYPELREELFGSDNEIFADFDKNEDEESLPF